MANRNTICPENIESFKCFLISKGYIISEGKSYYEVMRASHFSRKNPIIVYKRLASNNGSQLVHYTVLDRDMDVVKAFLRYRRVT